MFHVKHLPEIHMYESPEILQKKYTRLHTTTILPYLFRFFCDFLQEYKIMLWNDKE